MKKIMTLLNVLFVVVCVFFSGPSLSAEDWVEQGLSFLESRSYDDAIKAFSKAIEMNLNDTHAYNNRGVAWYRKGSYDRAIADYTKALDINPHYTDAYNNRGVAWYRKGSYDRAIADYTKALDINPHYTEAYSNLAWALAICPDRTYRNGAKAVELAQKAVELTPEPYALDTLAAAYAEAGKFVDAIATQKRAIALESKEGETEDLAEYRVRLKSYRANKPWREEHIIAEGKEPPRVLTINVRVGRVREGPSLDSRVKFKLKKGQAVSVIERKGDWYLVAPRSGWAHQSLFFDKGSAPKLSLASAEDRNTATLKVPIGRVREGPSLDSRVKFKLKKGQAVSVIERKDDWYLVELEDGRTGWAHQSLFFKSQ